MTISLASIILRALAAATGAAADVLAHSRPPQPVSAPPQGEATPAAPEPAGANDEQAAMAAFAAGLKMALAETPGRRRGARKPKPLFDEHDRLIPDWIDQGEGFLCQRRAALALRISRAQLLKLEGADRLLRSVSDDGRRVGYSIAQIEHLLAAVARAQSAGVQ